MNEIRRGKSMELDDFRDQARKILGDTLEACPWCGSQRTALGYVEVRTPFYVGGITSSVQSGTDWVEAGDDIYECPRIAYACGTIIGGALEFDVGMTTACAIRSARKNSPPTEADGP